MFCTKCGSQNSPDSRFCFNCGNRLVLSNTAESKFQKIIKGSQTKIEEGLKLAEEKGYKKSVLKFGRRLQRGFEKVPTIQFRTSQLEALQDNIKNVRQRKNYPKWIHAYRLLSFVGSTASAKNYNKIPEVKKHYENLLVESAFSTIDPKVFSQDPTPFFKKVEIYIQDLNQYDPTFNEIFSKWTIQLQERLEILNKVRLSKEFKNHELLYTKSERTELNKNFEGWAYGLTIDLFPDDNFFDELKDGMKNDSKIF